MLLPASFMAKFELVFVLTLENPFSQRFHFKYNRKSMGSSKKRYKIALHLRDWHVFMWQPLKIEKYFQYFNFETDFLENKNHFQKNCTTVFKLGALRLTYQKEQSFASNYFIFSKFCFSKNLLYRVDLLYQQKQIPIFVLFVSAGVLFDGAFSLWVSLRTTIL